MSRSKFIRHALSLILATSAILWCKNATAGREKEAIQATSSVECFLIKNATIARRKADKVFGIANVGHQISVGNNHVLAIRVFEDSGHGPDDQMIEKATLEFAAISARLGSDTTLTIPVVQSYYTAGSPGFMKPGKFVRGAGSFRSIRIWRDEEVMQASAKATFHARHPNFDKMKRIDLSWTCPVIHRTVDLLTPWEGKVGTSLDSFYSDAPDKKWPP